MGKNETLDKITGLYAALLISVVLIAVPHSAVSVMSGAIFLCLVLFAYMIRMDAEPESQSRAHTTYIIRSFWISLIFAIAGIALSAGGLTLLMLSGQMRTRALAACSGGDLSPCLPVFISDNDHSFTAASFVALGPAILYLLYRFAHGLARARGGGAASAL